MSLINDALKRAKEAQQQNPPTPPPGGPLRPVERPSRGGAPAWLWLVVIVILVGLGAFLIGQATRKNSETKSSESASTKTTTAQPASTEPTKSNSTPAVAAAPQPVVAPAIETNAMVAATQTNATEVAVEPVAPKPPTMKLQSIIYSPVRPSVMINGKLLFVGDAFGELRVVEIRRDSAVLAGAGRTNVLSLPEY